MATTTNYGWDTPDDTDLVKDGALAMRDLGQDVDTSLFSITGGKNVGLQYITNSSFTGVASVSLDNVFTAAYTNYVLVSTIFTDISNRAVNFVFRAGGVNLTSSAYTFANSTVTDAGVGSFTGGTTTAFEWTRAFGNSAVAGLQVATISQPALTVRKYIQRTASFNNGSNFVQQLTSCEINSVIVQDGFSLIAPAGTMTGTIRVYGIRN